MDLQKTWVKKLTVESPCPPFIIGTLMKSQRNYDEHIGKTCRGGRLSRNPQSWVVMTAAESMQEMYRSWVLEQQGLQIRLLIHYIFKHQEAYTTSH